MLDQVGVVKIGFGPNTCSTESIPFWLHTLILSSFWMKTMKVGFAPKEQRHTETSCILQTLFSQSIKTPTANSSTKQCHQTALQDTKENQSPDNLCMHTSIYFYLGSTCLGCGPDDMNQGCHRRNWRWKAEHGASWWTSDVWCEWLVSFGRGPRDGLLRLGGGCLGGL